MAKQTATKQTATKQTATKQTNPEDGGKAVAVKALLTEILAALIEHEDIIAIEVAKLIRASNATRKKGDPKSSDGRYLHLDGVSGLAEESKLLDQTVRRFKHVIAFVRPDTMQMD